MTFKKGQKVLVRGFEMKVVDFYPPNTYEVKYVGCDPDAREFVHSKDIELYKPGILDEAVTGEEEANNG